MARYTGPACRLCRQAGEKLFLKGDRCYTPKCSVDRRKSPPGAVSFRRRRPSEYGTQLMEKQKMRRMYGTLEKQFVRLFKTAQKRPGSTGEILQEILERRLDNVVYRLNFASSRQQARQLVNHGHFKVNGKKTDIPSYLVDPNDLIEWKESSKEKDVYKNVAENIPTRPVPDWLELNTSAMSGIVRTVPLPEHADNQIDSRVIVEFYSR
jgi:small subunit ribosomal protein S4